MNELSGQKTRMREDRSDWIILELDLGTSDESVQDFAIFVKVLLNRIMIMLVIFLVDLALITHTPC